MAVSCSTIQSVHMDTVFRGYTDLQSAYRAFYNSTAIDVTIVTVDIKEDGDSCSLRGLSRH